MDTHIGYEQLRYALWTVSYSNMIPSAYAQNRIWADSLNEAKGSTIGNILMSPKLIRAISIYHAVSRYSNYRDRPIHRLKTSVLSERKQLKKKLYVYHYIGSMHCVLKFLIYQLLSVFLMLIKKNNIYIYIYSGYGKYSDPLKFFTLCYIAAIC